MRKLELLVVVVFAALLGLKAHQPAVDVSQAVTLGPGTIPRQQALGEIARAIGAQPLGHPDGDIDFDGTPRAARDLLGWLGGWKLVGDVVMTFEVKHAPTFPDCGIRQEFLLERAPAAQVMALLQGEFPRVRFIPHPTMNGFYISSCTRDEALTMKRLMPDLDRLPVPDHLPVERWALARPKHLEAIRQGMATCHLPLELVQDGQKWYLAGSVGSLTTYGQRAAAFDRPSQPVQVDRAALLRCPPVCKFVDNRVACSEHCPGPLHQLGLRSGDVVEFLDYDQAYPVWAVGRGEREFNIFLDM
ncbi:MAG: hypothetical protein KC910_09270 [Candidatus Eremiobacteraeota bacterium]|nr:hypothetical protein [Candidatus Eremiobacteraeota bacterium]